MRIALLVEGDTEKAFLSSLRRFLQSRISGRMPRITPHPADGLLGRKEHLQKEVFRHLQMDDEIHVIALADVYTGTPRIFEDAVDAKRKMRQWVGPEPRFHPHAAQYDFEAWLLPYWRTIQRIAGSDRTPLADRPESINHTKPPSARLQEVFRTGSRGERYSKIRDAKRILQGQDLLIAANACPELKAFLNTILSLSEGELIP